MIVSFCAKCRQKALKNPKNAKNGENSSWLELFLTKNKKAILNLLKYYGRIILKMHINRKFNLCKTEKIIKKRVILNKFRTPFIVI